MRIRNLFIILAIIAVILLILQYIRQFRNIKKGRGFVSGGRVFFNWLLMIVLVVSIVGVGVTSFATHHEASSATSEKAKTVKAVSESTTSEDKEITLEFKKTARLNDNGEAKVKFIISPDTKVEIKGHRSGDIYKTFKATSGTMDVKREFTFDTPGEYDIVAKRGSKKVVKHLRIKEQNVNSSSSSSSAVSESSSSSSSSSAQRSSSASSTRNNSSSNNSSTSRSNASNSNGNANTGNIGSNYRGNGGGSSYQGGNGGSSYQGGNNGGSSNQQPAISNQPSSTISDQPD